MWSNAGGVPKKTDLVLCVWVEGFPTTLPRWFANNAHPVTILIQSALPIAMGEEDVAHKQGIGDVTLEHVSRVFYIVCKEY